MKQRHSSTRLWYHIVMPTKNREHFICSPEEAQQLKSSFISKAHELDAWLEEFGYWHDHVHLLLRTSPNIALSKIYGQLKGISAWFWNKRWPNNPFFWADGVFVATVDADNCDELRHYIRNQKRHHDEQTTTPIWEPENQ